MTKKTESKKENRGGARPGSGPKPITGVRMGVASIRLNEEQRTKLALLGGSAWIRKKIDAAKMPA